MFKSKSIRLFTVFTFVAFLFSFFAMPLVKPAKAAGVLFVSTFPAGSTCTGWIDTCSLQDALAIAAIGDEIWVQSGVYIPGGGRYDSFSLKDGVALYGGFAGGEMAVSERSYTANITVLSGDLMGDDFANGDGVVESSNDIAPDNSFHVVNGSGVGDTAVLDGFFVTAGQADDVYPDDSGAGLFIVGGNPTLRNLNFYGSIARNGGAIYIENGAPSLTNVRFQGNSAEMGGALFNLFSTPSLTNVVFFSNDALNVGGAIANFTTSDMTLINGTLSLNSAGSEGGAIYNDESSPVITNTLLWGNMAPVGSEIANSPTSMPVIAYSDIEGSGGSINWDSQLGIDSGNNLEIKPQFVDSVGGQLSLLVGSPIVDKGSNSDCPTADITGRARPQDSDQDGTATCDIGAYEHRFRIRYAAPSAVGFGDCSKWGDACLLQTALSSATAWDEIWVKQGIHYPTTGLSDVSATFQLVDGVGVYGGFAGTELTRTLRNYTTNITVLSGDIDKNDTTNASGVVTDAIYITGTNSYHVVTGNGVTQTAVFDGFTVTAGKNYFFSSGGGGMANNNGSPTVNNSTFSGNYAAYLGGGMYANKSDLILTNLTFHGNRTSSGFADSGGGLYSKDSTIVLNGGLFISNTTNASGGGMATVGTITNHITLTNVSFVRNTADSGGGLSHGAVGSFSQLTFAQNNAVYGGGMYNSGQAEIDQATFSQNTADSNGGPGGSGGAIYNTVNGSLSLENSTIISNSALFTFTLGGNLTMGNGGGIFDHLGVINLNVVTFTANAAVAGGLGGSMGGGFYSLGGDTTMTTTKFISNTADLGGGATFYSGTVSINAGRFMSNTAGYGGGLYGIHGDYSFSGFQVYNSTFSQNQAWSGGGVYLDYDTASTFENVSFTQNRANGGDGGGLANVGTENSFVGRYLTFTENTALSGNGGGLDNVDSSITLSQTSFTQNRAVHGGGIFHQTLNPSMFSYVERFAGITLTQNIAQNGNGGGMHNSYGKPQLEDVTFSSNSVITSGSGGGLYTFQGATMISGTTFMSNTAPVGGGTAVYTGSQAITNSQFTGNSTANNGGAIYSVNGTNTVSETVFYNNSAIQNGGAIFTTQGSKSTLNRSRFYGNQASNGYGGGVATQGSGGTFNGTTLVMSGNSADRGGGMGNDQTNITLKQSTFSENSANHGYGMWNKNSTQALTNNIFWSSPAITGSRQISNSGSNTLNFAYNLVQGSGGSSSWDSSYGVDNGNNVDGDPRFADIDGADNITGTVDDYLRITSDSPAIDGGLNINCPATDIAGLPRPLDGNKDGAAICDSGAHEWVPTNWVVTSTLITAEVSYDQPSTYYTYTLYASNAPYTGFVPVNTTGYYSQTVTVAPSYWQIFASDGVLEEHFGRFTFVLKPGN